MHEYLQENDKSWDFKLQLLTVHKSCSIFLLEILVSMMSIQLIYGTSKITLLISETLFRPSVEQSVSDHPSQGH